jgi:hypothetical protein
MLHALPSQALTSIWMSLILKLFASDLIFANHSMLFISHALLILARHTPYAAPDELVVVRHQDTKLLRASSHLRVSSRAPWRRCCWIQYQADHR